MTKKNEVAVKEETSNWLETTFDSKQSTHTDDNFGSDDVVLPRIKLLSATSDEIQTFDEAQAGHFWHTGLDIDLGDNIEFTIIVRNKKVLLVAPMDDGQGVLARAEDAKTWDRIGDWEVLLDRKTKTKAKWEITDLNVAKSGLTNWGTSNPAVDESAPAATTFYDYVVVMPSRPDLGAAVISLSRTAIKQAKKGLNAKISLHGNNGRPMQALVFAAKVGTATNESGQDYFIWLFRQNGFVTSKEEYERYANLAVVMQDFSVADEGDAMNDGQSKASDDTTHAGGEF